MYRRKSYNQVAGKSGDSISGKRLVTLRQWNSRLITTARPELHQPRSDTTDISTEEPRPSSALIQVIVAPTTLFSDDRSVPSERLAWKSNFLLTPQPSIFDAKTGHHRNSCLTSNGSPPNHKKLSIFKHHHIPWKIKVSIFIFWS